MIAAEPKPIRDYCLGIYDGPHATPAEADEGPYFLGIKNITEDGRLDFSVARYVSETEFPKWTRRVQPAGGDVVFTYEATLHRYALIPEGFRGCLGRRVALVRPDPTKVDSRFLLYYFLSRGWRDVMESNVISGATVDRIPLERFPQFPAALPALPTQQRAAEMLSTYDDLIDNNRRRIKLLEDAVRLLFDEWFVRRRFPGASARLPPGELPAGWRREALGKLTSKIGSGATPRGGEASYVEEGVALIRSQNVYDYEFVDEGLALIGEDQAARLDGVTVVAHDVLLNITGASVGRCCMVPSRLVPARVNQHVMIIRAAPGMDPHYLLCAINSDERKRQLLSYAQTGSTREALTKDLMSAFEVLVPDAATLEAFGQMARDVFDQREVLTAQNIKLRTARDLLLPRLMSGEVTV